MRSIQSVSPAMQLPAPKNSATRFGSVNANAPDSVTFGKQINPKPYAMAGLITLALSALAIGGYTVKSYQKYVRKEAARTEYIKEISKKYYYNSSQAKRSIELYDQLHP